MNVSTTALRRLREIQIPEKIRPYLVIGSFFLIIMIVILVNRRSTPAQTQAQIPQLGNPSAAQPQPQPQLNLSPEQKLAELTPAARVRIQADFVKAGVAYPPSRLILLGIKDSKTLQVYAPGPDAKYRWVKTYPVLAASGMLGPKLRRGDRQVPEGIYSIPAANPASSYHLSLRVDYPNATDLKYAAIEKRGDLGTDIYIHGDAKSIGCLAMGNPAIEEIYTLAMDAGLSNIGLILSPVDFRLQPRFAPAAGQPSWVAGLYQQIGRAIAKLPLPPG